MATVVAVMAAIATICTKVALLPRVIAQSNMNTQTLFQDIIIYNPLQTKYP